MLRAQTDVPAPRSPLCEVPVQALLDALPDAAAVLDASGSIVAVNRIWRMFALDNGGRAEDTCEGVNYLEVCRLAAEQGCEDAAATAAGLAAVLRGETVESDLEYACPSPSVGRWFIVRVTAMPGDPPGALVTHVNITRRKAAEDDLRHRASSDPLTGLANRAALVQRLTRALSPRAGRTAVAEVGVLCLDLDDFKPVNDTFGHAAGDEVLQQVSQRLLQVVRPQDTVARFGGDEFVVVLPRITEQGLAGLVERLGASLELPHDVHGRRVRVSASIGAHLATAGDEPDAVLARADQAMYAAKRTRPTARGQGRRRP